MAKRRQVEPHRAGGAPRSSAAGGRSPPLDTEKIVDAALRIIDAKGLPALSMRAIGQALGTSAMALYFHFSSKDDLLAAVARRLIALVPALATPNADGAARARSILAQLRAVRSLHPNAYALVDAELARTSASPAGRAAWTASWPGLSAVRADLLRITLAALAAERESETQQPPQPQRGADEPIDAELIALFFGYTRSP